ncbi:MAG: hypothetical protein K2J71_04790 [Oscillospiraceae bacterium]|nr:hypothetical protein [Oscillospiraceae bacterium]
MENTNSSISYRKLFILSVAAIIVLLMILFKLSHSISIRYNDWWIIGNTVEAVESRYGQFDKNIGNKRGYYISSGNSWVMPDHLSWYYWMKVDENGIITEVYIDSSPGG